MRLARMAILTVCVLLAVGAVAQVPHLLNVQGALRNAAGEVVTGQYAMTFRFFSAETGGTKLVEWSPPAPVNVTQGVFSVNVPISQNVFASSPSVWLEIQVGTDVLPRRQVTSVGFAYMAERAAECVSLIGAATDLDCSGDGCVDATELDPAIKWARADVPGGAALDLACENPAGCVVGTEIVDGTIKTADLGDGAVTSSKLASDLTLQGNTTTSNLLVKGLLYTGDSMGPGTIRLTNTGALQNITTITMSDQLTSTVTGKAPFAVSSPVLVTNLNADMLDGQHGAFYQNASNLTSGTVDQAR